VPNEVDEELSIDKWTMSNAISLIKQHLASEKADKPFYISVGFPSPHPPFINSPSENETVEHRHFPPAVDNEFIEPRLVTGSRKQYAGVVHRLDKLIGEMLDFLDKKGLSKKTVVMVTADHGEHLGDNGFFGKASPWEPAARVPLVVAGADVLEGRVVKLPVATLDLVGTMLDYAGLVPLPGMDSMTLRPLLNGTSASPQRGFVTTALTSSANNASFYNVIEWFPSLKKTLKLICCESPDLCPKRPSSMMPYDGPGAQVALIHVGESTPGDLENLLQRPHTRERHCPEANTLLAKMPSQWGTACAWPLQAACYRE